jgi:hypothetical protein
LETTEGTYYFFKADILKGLITYSTDKNFMANTVTISARNAFEIINMNKRGEKLESLTDTSNMVHKPIDLVEQESLTRFDKRKNNNRKKKKKAPNPAPDNNAKETKEAKEAKQPSNAKPKNKQPNRKPNKNNNNEKAQANQQENK